MPEVVRFHDSRPEVFQFLGLNYEAVSRILLGSAIDTAPALPAVTPERARAFIMHEYEACGVTYRALSGGRLETPHPVTGTLASSFHGFAKVIHPFSCMVLFRFVGEPESGYCLVFADVTSRVTHIVIPSHNSVVYYIDPTGSADIWDAAIASWNTRLPGYGDRHRIGIVDMVDNFAHQAMNHLSGLERLIGSGTDQFLEEIWISGREYFGQTEEVFPELEGKIRHRDRHEITRLLDKPEYDAYKLGSVILPAHLVERLKLSILKSTASKAISKDRFPIVAFTTRTAGRRCLNLPEVLADVTRQLLVRYPKLGVVFDGWVFPESSIQFRSSTITALLPLYRDVMSEEAQLCSEIARQLPPDVLVTNLIGTSIRESIRGLQDVDAYLAHVGTLQHKLGWFTRARGVVHGPTSQISGLDMGAYSFEGGHPPIPVRAEDVEDVPSDTGRGPGFFDYRIVDTSMIVREIDRIISSLAT